MSRLVQGAEVGAALEASAQRAKELGIDDALVELGFEPQQLRLAAMRDAHDWMQHLPVGATYGAVEALVASAACTSITAGIRLGRMYSPASLITGEDADVLRDVIATLEVYARTNAARASGLDDDLRTEARRIAEVLDDKGGT